MKYDRAFTLVEVMVVMSIISLLSSFLMTRVTQARAKAQDAARMQTVIQVNNAIKAYTLDKGVRPTNFNGTSVALSSDAPDGTGQNAFQKSMQQLVDNKNLSAIPQAIGGVPFVYYDYGGTIGALFGTTLSATAPSLTGAAGSCRLVTGPSQAQCNAAYSIAMGAIGYCSSPGSPQCNQYTTNDFVTYAQCYGASGYGILSIDICMPGNQNGQMGLDLKGLSNVSWAVMQPICAAGGVVSSNTLCSSSSANSDFCMCSAI